MKIREFANILDESFSVYFNQEVKTNIEFEYSEFTVEAHLVKNNLWTILNKNVILYDARIALDENNELRVKFIDFPFTGEMYNAEKEGMTLDDAVTYINSHIITDKSEAIYDNF